MWWLLKKLTRCWMRFICRLQSKNRKIFLLLHPKNQLSSKWHWARFQIQSITLLPFRSIQLVKAEYHCKNWQISMKTKRKHNISYNKNRMRMSFNPKDLLMGDFWKIKPINPLTFQMIKLNTNKENKESAQRYDYH